MGSPSDTVLEKARQALADAALSGIPRLGDGPGAASRLKDVTLDQGVLKLVVASDGLDLGTKERLEKALTKAMEPAGPFAEIRVYFKRQTPAAVPSKAATASGRKEIPGVARILVVASGKGGVGKSTVSTNLAVALARMGRSVGLLDADIYGPSVPLMLGIEGPLEVGPGEKLLPREAHGIRTVSFGFMTDSRQPVIWRGPMVAKALRQFAHDVAWGELDELILDLPPGTGDVQLSLIEGLRISGAVIVSTPQDVALLDAHKALSMFERLEVPVLGLVENMSCFTCPACGHEEPLFGTGGGAHFAEARRIPLLGRVPLTRGVREAGDRGRPIALSPEDPAGRAFSDLAEAIAAMAKPYAPVN